MPRPLAPARFVVRMLEEAAWPIFALDAQRKIVLANRALGQWLGLDADELIGRTCSYTSSGDQAVDAACAGLCPPPEAFTGEATDGAVSRLANGDRAFERRRARFVTIAGSEANQALLLVLVQPAEAASAGHQATGVLPERLHGL